MSDKSILTGAKKPLSSLDNATEEITNILVTKIHHENDIEACAYIATKNDKYYCHCYLTSVDIPVYEIARDSIFAYIDGMLYGTEEEPTLVGILANAILNNEIEIVQDKEADVTLYC